MAHLDNDHSTIWVCEDCTTARECDGASWDLLGTADVSMGILWEDHHEDCNNAKSRLNDEPCDCEDRDFSDTNCGGCGTTLAGKRLAYTLWH